MTQRRKTMGALLLIAAALALILAGCAAQDPQPRQEDMPELKIGLSRYEPYAYIGEDGAYTGADVDLAREACRRMGYAPVFVEIDWEQRDAALADGTVDCIWNCYSMTGREDLYLWAGPYLQSRQMVMVLESSEIQTLSDLTGRRVAVMSARQVMPLESASRPPKMAESYQSPTSIFALFSETSMIHVV